MRGSAATMKLISPRGAAQAVAAYARAPHAAPLAGGTDFMVLWNAGLLNGRSVLDLSGVKEWKKIQTLKTSLRVGSLVTHAQLQEHPLIQKQFPLLVQACATVGAAQIQNRGTLGGNIANASPAGDTFPPLALYEPLIYAVSAQGKRVIPFSEIFTGVKKTSLRPSELIEAVEIPFLAKRPSRQIFRKVGTRSAQAISKTVAAGLLWLEKDGRVRELRFALGSMAPTVRRLKRAEAFVAGKKLTPDVIQAACDLVKEDVSPVDDVRSTKEYRLYASESLLRQLLENKR